MVDETDDNPEEFIRPFGACFMRPAEWPGPFGVHDEGFDSRSLNLQRRQGRLCGPARLARDDAGVAA